MSQLRRSLTWLVKVFLGYASLATPTFAILYWALRLSVRQLLPPYFILFVFDAVGVLMMFDARKHIDQPKWFRLRVSVAVFVILFSFLAVVYYFGSEYGLIGPDYRTMTLVTGLLGTGTVSVGMFFYLRRWLHLRNSEK